MDSLEEFRVLKAPPSIYYIPDFLSEDEEIKIIEHVNAAPKPKWTQLSNRRLQNWGGLPHPKGMVSEDIPKWLQTIMDKVSALQMFGSVLPNHVLINEYLPSQGIMPHEDGPLFYPTITTVNLGSHTILDLYHNSQSSVIESQNEHKFNRIEEGKILLERRSLLVVKDAAYTSYLHGIKEQDQDEINQSVFNLSKCKSQIGDVLYRDTRLSLTIRNVPKVFKAKLMLGRRR